MLISVGIALLIYLPLFIRQFYLSKPNNLKKYYGITDENINAIVAQAQPVSAMRYGYGLVDNWQKAILSIENNQIILRGDKGADISSISTNTIRNISHISTQYRTYLQIELDKTGFWSVYGSKGWRIYFGDINQFSEHKYSLFFGLAGKRSNIGSPLKSSNTKLSSEYQEAAIKTLAFYFKLRSLKI